jgi:hypothetical protein
MKTATWLIAFVLLAGSLCLAQDDMLSLPDVRQEAVGEATGWTTDFLVRLNKPALHGSLLYFTSESNKGCMQAVTAVVGEREQSFTLIKQRQKKTVDGSGPCRELWVFPNVDAPDIRSVHVYVTWMGPGTKHTAQVEELSF